MALVSKRSLEIRDLDETIEKQEVVATLCLALGRPAFEGSCRLFTRFVGMKTAVMQVGEADVSRLLQLKNMQKFPSVSGASGTAIGPVAATTPTGKMPVRGVVRRGTRPKILGRPRGA